MLTRRSILRGLIAAPAIVSAGSIMPVRLWKSSVVEDTTIFVARYPDGSVWFYRDTTPSANWDITWRRADLPIGDRYIPLHRGPHDEAPGVEEFAKWRQNPLVAAS
jgi:hypothetical protein